jgi:simple sugar transport system permease protein
MVVASVWLKANQILVGFALFVLLPNLTAFLFIQSSNQGSVTPMSEHSIPGLAHLPILGPMLFQQSYLFYLAVVAAALVAVFFARTRRGLNVIAVGHDPAAARTRGIRPTTVQAAAVLFCGVMAGLGGAALSIGSVGNFTPGIIDGRGLIVVATVILGRWTVTGVFAGSIMIGVLTAAQLVYSDSTFIPIQVFGALPWAIVLIALLVSLRLRSNQPRTL